MWNALLAGVVLQHPTVESLLRELRRNGELHTVCGFNVIHGSEAVPPAWAMLRFVANVAGEEALIKEMLVTRASELVTGFGRQLAFDGNWHPHVHVLVSRGGWTRDWQWVPVPYVDEHAAELLLSWWHTGFSVHNGVRVEPGEKGSLERLARYILRPPISLDRMRWDGGGEVRHRRKSGDDGGVYGSQGSLESFDPADFLARVIMHGCHAWVPRSALLHRNGSPVGLDCLIHAWWKNHAETPSSLHPGCDVSRLLPRSTASLSSMTNTKRVSS